MAELEHTAEESMPHILVVDDEPEIRKMVALCLQKSRFRVSCADDAADACRMLVVESFDVVISDVMMPGEDGIAFLGRVHESWPDLPVILMTGHAQLQMAVNAIKNGAFDFIHKPFDFEHMRKIVMRAINYRNLQKMEKNYRAELEETVARRTAQLRESMAELDFARNELQRAATEKSTFMSTVTHEMRTPMNGVIGCLELLADEGLQGPCVEYLAMARQSADNMLKLIDQLLSFNSGTLRDGSTSRHDLVDVRILLQDLAAEYLPRFARKGIRFSLQLPGNLPHQIWTDREKLERLLEIILGNALKFTERGEALVDVVRSSDESGDDMLSISVTDSGIGIPDGMLERIFEPFVQADSSLSRRYEGVGLGLAIARQNAALLNGQVMAEHVPTGGSRFIVSMKISTP